ncbi:MAG TPA: BON domain-containing protein [Phycisphaerales bacterium]|nr:BON domain-containing protein [Phycisphaerales bacterium]
MKTRTALVLILLQAGFVMASCERAPGEATPNATPTSTRAPAPGTAPDNTARNKVDRGTETKTPMDQSNTSSDIRITADIRRAIMEDSTMSTNAQNCKVITDKAGVVTLRGPVQSQAEKDSIEAKAAAVAGVSRVVNELEVKP